MIHFVWMPQAHGVVRGYLLADWDVAPLIRLALHEGARKNIYIIKKKKKKEQETSQQLAATKEVAQKQLEPRLQVSRVCLSC